MNPFSQAVKSAKAVPLGRVVKRAIAVSQNGGLENLDFPKSLNPAHWRRWLQRAPQRPIGWLGEIPLAYASTLTGINESQRTTVVEHPLIGGKPGLEITGDELRELRVTIALHEQLCDVTTELNRLEALRASYRAWPLQWASGEVVSDFLILEWARNATWLAETGEPRAAVVEVSLKEYVSVDAIDEATIDAQRNAPARKTP